MNEIKNLSATLIADISNEELFLNFLKRLENYFVITEEDKKILKTVHDQAIIRLENCILGIENKYFKKNGSPFFSYSHSGQYLIYLYFISNCLSQLGSPLMDKVYYLNKILHSVDIYGAVELPNVFFFEHPLGMVLGRAKYGENFFAMQGCTIGGNNNTYPILGKNLKMYSNSKILGNSIIGDNVIIGANTYVKDTNIPNNVMVFGQYPNLILKENIK